MTAQRLSSTFELSLGLHLAPFTTDLAALVLGGASPDSSVLIGHECVLEALTLDAAAVAHRPG